MSAAFELLPSPNNEVCTIMLTHKGSKCGAPAMVQCTVRDLTWYLCDKCYELIRDKKSTSSIPEMQVRSLAQ